MSHVARGSHWHTSSIAVLPELELRGLQLLLSRGNADGALRMLDALQSVGAIGASSVEHGAPVHARVHHAEMPRYAPMVALDHLHGPPGMHDGSIITTDDIESAFAQLAEPETPQLLQVSVLRHAVTAPLLQRRPLTPAEWEAMRDALGVEEHGVVALASFNASLSVLPPMAPRPKRARRWCCCCNGILRAVGRGGSSSVGVTRYAEADLEGFSDEDATLGNDAEAPGFRSIGIAI